MWLLLGGGAVIFAALNVIETLKEKNTKWLRFISMTLTVLTVCAIYADSAARVTKEDWAGLMDVVPVTSGMLWGFAVISIVVNSISLFVDNH